MPRRSHWFQAPAAAATLVLSTTSAIAQAPTQVPSQPPALTPCDVRGLTGDVVCGSVRVPENRSRPDSRQIDLRVVIARATTAARRPDPFLLLAGGPGQAASDMGPFATDAFSRVREQRDIVLVDARGTGGSNGLRCPLMRRPEDFGGSTIYPDESVRACRDSLERVADLTQYTTANIADDLEAVRRAFNWPALNFYGTSYGSRLALTFLRRHEKSVRTMVLKAVAPPSLIAPMNYAVDVERAFTLLERDCRADRACAATFPSIRADLDTVLARAATGSIRAVVPWGGAADTIAITRDAIAGAFVNAMQSAAERSRLPAALRQAASGNAVPLATVVIQLRRVLDNVLYVGMHLSVSCGEDGRMLDLERARQDDGRTFLGSARVRMLADACRDWPTPPATPGAHDPVRSRVPVLLVSGELDPNTPPRHAEDALRYLRNGRHVVLAGVAHGWSNVTACGSAFVADFVARASVANLEVSCARVSRAPAFVVR